MTQKFLSIMSAMMGRELQQCILADLNKNTKLLKAMTAQEVSLWKTTGRITGNLRTVLQKRFDTTHRADFEAEWRGYINDDEFDTILTKGSTMFP
jgi:hypothetical protein